jgi:hypothetical protein
VAVFFVIDSTVDPLGFGNGNCGAKSARNFREAKNHEAVTADGFDVW